MKKIFIATIILFFFQLSNAQMPNKSWWTFDYPNHRSLDSGLLNLRYLNESFAGENGFIKLSNNGNAFVHGGGKEIRFWACNGGGLANEFSDEKLDTLSKFLSKMGVNIIRYHGSINPHGKGTDINSVDTTEANNIWRCVAAMKKQGIYTVISPFWPHNGHMGGWVPEEWGIDGYAGKDDLWAVIYFNDRLKNAYKSWVKYLYTTPNKYTGIALKDEPAVAVIQVENEDAVFFWTMAAIKPALSKMIGDQFAHWLNNKYGSLQAATKYWEANASLPGDTISKGIVALYPFYQIALSKKEATTRRLTDQLEFYALKQKSFYDEMVSYYRYELGCKQLTNGNNWRTAAQSRLLDLERWTNSSADIIAVNKYFDPQHKGANDGWRVDPGDFYGAPSALKNPADLPLNIKHIAAHPMMITESGWNLPNKYQTEGPLLVAAYGGLTGLDAFFWFTPTAPTYERQLHFPHFRVQEQYPLSRWSNSTPGEIGMFPANALIQRLGYVKETIAIEEYRTMSSMLNREIPKIFEEQSFDPNRDFINPDKANEGVAELGALSFLTGGVTTSYRSSKDSTYLHAKLSTLINTTNKTVKSITGEQFLDYNQGIFILNTPKAKAVSGFLNTRKTFSLGEVVITSNNEYATIELVSMDEKKLSESKKILLQVGTIFRPTNWKEEPATRTIDNKKISGFNIINTGNMPWQAMPSIGSISIQNPFIHKATQLDAAGYPIKQLNLNINKGKISLVLPSNALYILLEY